MYTVYNNHTRASKYFIIDDTIDVCLRCKGGSFVKLKSNISLNI